MIWPFCSRNISMRFCRNEAFEIHWYKQTNNSVKSFHLPVCFSWLGQISESNYVLKSHLLQVKKRSHFNSPSPPPRQSSMMVTVRNLQVFCSPTCSPAFTGEERRSSLRRELVSVTDVLAPQPQTTARMQVSHLSSPHCSRSGRKFDFGFQQKFE